jgi:DNA-binding NarL/FixJ family response regulator
MPHVTKLEKQIVQLFKQGLEVPEIAIELHMSECEIFRAVYVLLNRHGIPLEEVIPKPS